MSDPLVSVIVPSYNHSRYAHACVESVLAQDFQNWEMIVVDDRSSDESVEVFRSFIDSRIQVHVNSQNLGTYPTQNRAVELSRGQFIAVLNSDDFWEPQKLGLQVSVLEEQPELSFSYTLGTIVDESGVAITGHDQTGDNPTSPRHVIFDYLLSENRILASSVIFRREYAKFVEGYPSSGDWLTLFQAAHGREVALVAEPLTKWRIHGSSTHRKQLQVSAEHAAIRSAILRQKDRWLKESSQPALTRQKLYDCAIALTADQILLGNQMAARRAARSALSFKRNAPALKRLLASYLPRQIAVQRMWPNMVGSDPSSVKSYPAPALL